MVAGTKLTNDLLGTGLEVASVVAEIAGAEAVAGALGGVGLAAAAVGWYVAGLVEAIEQGNERASKTKEYFDILNAGYHHAGYGLDKEGRALIPQYGVPIGTLDLEHNTVSFGKFDMLQYKEGRRGMGGSAAGGWEATLEPFDDGRTFEIHAGLGVKHTIALPEQRDLVLLPFMPAARAKMVHGVQTVGLGPVIRGMDGKLDDRGNPISFKTYIKSEDELTGIDLTFESTTVDVLLGQASKTLVMPNMARSQIKDGHGTNWDMQYRMRGKGGKYALALSAYGSVTLQENGDSKSTWLLDAGAKGLGDAIAFQGDHLAIGGAQVWIDRPANTKVCVQKADSTLYKVDAQARKIELGGVAAGWIEAHAKTLLTSLAQLAKEQGADKLEVIGYPGPGGQALEGCFSAKSGYLVCRAEPGASLVRNAHNGAGILLVDASWVKAHQGNLLGALGALAGSFGCSTVEVLGIPAQGMTLPGGRYDRVSGELLGRAADGVLYRVAGDLSRRVLGVDASWSAAHRATLPQDLANLSMEASAGILSVAGIQSADGGISPGWYDVGRHLLVAGNTPGKRPDYLGIMGGKVWLFDPSMGKLYSHKLDARYDSAPDCFEIADPLSGPPDIKGWVKSASISGDGFVIETGDGRILSLRPGGGKPRLLGLKGRWRIRWFGKRAVTRTTWPGFMNTTHSFRSRMARARDGCGCNPSTTATNIRCIARRIFRRTGRQALRCWARCRTASSCSNVPPPASVSCVASEMAR